jgi:hypothetical protein
MGIDDTSNIVLGSLRYKSSQDKGVFLNVPLEQTSKEIIEFDRNVDLNLETVFDDERQESTIFRPVCKYSVIFKNEYTGTTTYTPFKNNLYYTNAVNNAVSTLTNPNTPWDGYPQYFEFDLMRVDNNVPGYTQGPNNHVNFVNKSAATYNWSFYLSYAFENDYLKPMYAIDPQSLAAWSWTAMDGIPFYILNGNDQNGDSITFKCPMKHGLESDEYVELSISYNNQNTFRVTSLGDNGYDSNFYIFNIDNIGYTGTTFQTGTIGTFKRIINESNPIETKSKYYVRRHKILTAPECAILTKAGFEQINFSSKNKLEKAVLTPNNNQRSSVKDGNQSYTLSFNCDVDIKPLLDNQKRPISELYFTSIWKGYFGWTKYLKQGFDFNLPLINNLPNLWWDQTNFLSNTPINQGQYFSNTLPPVGPFNFNLELNVGDIIDGDFCEWNDYYQTERVISRVNHKFVYNDQYFNIPTGAPAQNQFGYYYKPHNPITIREYSGYIEEGPSNIFNIPDYAFYSNLSNGFRWRDLYPYGYIDTEGVGVDYPFLNGKHYPYTNIVFRVFPEGIGVQNITEITQPTTDECE